MVIIIISPPIPLKILKYYGLFKQRWGFYTERTAVPADHFHNLFFRTDPALTSSYIEQILTPCGCNYTVHNTLPQLVHSINSIFLINIIYILYIDITPAKEVILYFTLRSLLFEIDCEESVDLFSLSACHFCSASTGQIFFKLSSNFTT